VAHVCGACLWRMFMAHVYASSGAVLFFLFIFCNYSATQIQSGKPKNLEQHNLYFTHVKQGGRFFRRSDEKIRGVNMRLETYFEQCKNEISRAVYFKFSPSGRNMLRPYIEDKR
jgi:hypothetical protein